MTTPRTTICAAIRTLRKEQGLGYGGAGNCAVFAAALNAAFEGEGTYLTADSGQHYQFVDHVAWLHEGTVYDIEGAWTPENWAQRWSEDEDEPVEVEEITDLSPDGGDLRRLVDEGNGLLARTTVFEDAVRLLQEAAAAPPVKPSTPRLRAP